MIGGSLRYLPSVADTCKPLWAKGSDHCYEDGEVQRSGESEMKESPEGAKTQHF